MKRELKYFLLLGIAALIYLAVKLFSPREFDWTVTLHKDDKNPFGTYVLHTLLRDLFPGHQVTHSYRTAYELYDSADRPVNFLSISNTFSPDREDVDALLKNIEQGGNAFIAAEYFYGPFSDTLETWASDYYFQAYATYHEKGDTSSLIFKNPALTDDKEFFFPRNNIRNYFIRFDSTATVIAINDMDFPITIHIKRGKGNLYLNSTPLAFSNAYLLGGNNPEFISRSLSFLPPGDLLWTEYYQNGRLEVSSPLRFVLTTEPLRWAYYLTLFAIVVFMLFEAKRKQRIIPVIKPLANTSLEFVSTIGNLYFQNGDHKDIAHKKISYFLEQVRTRYWLDTNRITRDFIRTLARRSGHTHEEVENLFNLIGRIQAAQTITAADLMALNKAMEKFQQTTPA